jgi:uncharacterized protein YkwD
MFRLGPYLFSAFLIPSRPLFAPTICAKFVFKICHGWVTAHCLACAYFMRLVPMFAALITAGLVGRGLFVQDLFVQDLFVQDQQSKNVPLTELDSVKLERPNPVSQANTQPGALENTQASNGIKFRVTPASGAAPLTVTFEITEGDAASFNWDFGDGSSMSGTRVKHTYFKPGQFTARLETRSEGQTTRGEIAIQAKNAGPERAQMTVLFETGNLATLDARRSLVYGPFTRATWIFADGTRTEGLKIQHQFRPGVQAVRLEIQGSAGKLSQVLPVSPSSLAGNADFDRQVLALTNQARAKNWDCARKRFPNPGSVAGTVRLGALEANGVLDRAARAQSAGMALSRYFDHQSSLDSSHPADRVSATDYAWQTVGENIAAGQPTPAVVVDAWLRSPGHCKNIMNPDFTQIGLSFVQRPSSKAEPQVRNFWTQVFARPDASQ